MALATKRFTSTGCTPAASVSIDIPSSSAIQQEERLSRVRLDLDCGNNNINQQALPAYNCHHQAATRTLILSPSSQSVLAPRTEPSIAPNAQPADQHQHHDPPTPPPNYHEIPGIVPAFQGRTSGPPPSYDDVVNPNAHPPTYQSLFGQAREARKTSNGLVDLFRQLFLILIGTVGCTLIIGFLLLIPITMILVGLVYVNQCRAENIPSFLVIGGLVWIVKNVLNCYNQFKKDSSTANRPPPRRAPIVHHNTSTHANNANTSNQNQSTHTVPTATTRMRTNQSAIRDPSLIGITSFKCESMLNYFLIVWYLAGCIIVYRIYEPDYDNPTSASYCNRTVYQYAFWLMTSACTTVAVVLSCLCCLMVSSLMSCNHGR